MWGRANRSVCLLGQFKLIQTMKQEIPDRHRFLNHQTVLTHLQIHTYIHVPMKQLVSSSMTTMSEGEWILLDFMPSMFGSRVRIALEEKGINYEYREEDLPQKSALLLRTNPVHEKIPVLIHNGQPICESLNILEYIDDVHSTPHPLLPSDAYGKARARFWADFIDKKLQVSGMKVAWYKSKQELEEGKKEVMDCLELLEEELGQQPYFGGEAFGYLDVVLGGFCSWFYAYEAFGNISIGKNCPNVMAWAKRCMDRPSFSKSLMEPEKLIDFVVNTRKKGGLD
ncbi:glutathione S-transferase U20-like [Andrographis paniculata]|uniref:glutathione S-transferase U20-like n=1 Tax=Andrographis paniculata TaxID=175694 RepID=UPI0021E8E190|nr:glutathione S-transferase U20-like [Andrographis paniculata]